MNQAHSTDEGTPAPSHGLDWDETDLSAPSANSLADSLLAARQLVAGLRGPAAGRSRIGFLTHPLYDLAELRNVAARLGCDLVFLPQIWLERLPTGATFTSISVTRLLDTLDDITQVRSSFDIAMVSGLDLLLTRLEPAECEQFWNDIPQRLPHRPRALILTLPHPFALFGPDLSRWEPRFTSRID